MRLLIVNSAPVSVFGGVEQWLLSAATGLTRRGHHVHGVGRPGSRFAGRLRAAGVPVTERHLGFEYDPVSAYHLARLSRSEGSEIAFVNLNRELSHLALARRWSPIRSVIGRGVLPLMDTQRRHRRLYSRHLDGIVCSSRGSCETLRSTPWLERARFARLTGGVDRQAVEAARERAGGRAGVREALSIPDDAFLIGGIGRFERHKGFHNLVSAFNIVAARYSDIYLVLVGDGPEDHALRDLAGRDPESASRILFTGHRPDTDRFSMALDVLVMPSTSRFETFGHAVLEAMAFGVPVIASDIGGLPEIVLDGKTGLTVPAGDVSALRSALTGLREDPDRRARLGEAAALRAFEEYGLSGMLDGLETYLQSLLT